MELLVLRSKIFLFIVLICNGITNESSLEDYFNERQKIVDEEASMSFGAKMRLDEEEKRANDILMKYKNEELKSSVEYHRSFLPAKSFLKVSCQIEHSRVFQVIRKMPKGGVLHAHAHAITSRDYILGNITRRPNLYICRSIQGGLRLRFFDEPTASSRSDCNWESLEIARTQDEFVDSEIEEALSMVEQEYSRPTKDSDTAWGKFLRIFRFVKSLITYRPVYEDFLYHLLEEVYDDNIQFIEVRTPFSNLYELNGFQHDHLRVMEIYKAVVDRFIVDHPNFMGVKWIYSPQRNVHRPTFEHYIETFKALKKRFPNLVTGFDLVGQEDRGRPLKDFIEELQLLSKEADFFFHAGETNWNGQQIDENLIDAILLNSKRIGHGYALIKHPKLMDLVKSKKICLEISPISNQVLNLVKDLRNHPAGHFFARDLPVVISNDDPSFWGARALSYDFYEAFVGIMSSKADLRSLKQLALNSIVHSSLNDTEKNLAYQVWAARWRKFVRYIVKYDDSIYL